MQQHVIARNEVTKQSLYLGRLLRHKEQERGSQRHKKLMILFSLIVSILLSTASFTWGYFQAGYETITKYILGFGILYFISRWRKWKWFPSVAMVISLLLAIFGLWNDFPLVWMFSGAIFALIAWDLNQFQEKLNLLPDREDKRGMTRRRLIRISILALVGLTIAFAIEYLFNF